MFCGWRHKWDKFLAILAQITRAQDVSWLDVSISLKFLLETRLESESFEPLIGFLEQLQSWK